MSENIYLRNLSPEEQERVNLLQQDAEATPASDKGLAIHTRAIGILRGKGYSYRGIAAWFTERGFKVNHVDVWRAHKNSMEPQEVFDATDCDKEWGEFMTKRHEGNTTHYEERKLSGDDESKSKPSADVGGRSVKARKKGSAKQSGKK